MYIIKNIMETENEITEKTYLKEAKWNTQSPVSGPHNGATNAIAMATATIENCV